MVDTLSAGTRRTPGGTLTSAEIVSWFAGIGKKKDSHFAVWLGATGGESI